MKSVIKPGAGWKRLNGSVYEHKNGIRIHVHGRMIRTKDGIIKILTSKEERFLDAFIAVNGGNKKRGIMAFAKFKYHINQ